MVRDHDLILFERKRLWPGLKNECAWHVIKILSIFNDMHGLIERVF